MGMNVGGNSGGVQSEINVTPLIDVLLVLLIIFIVIMPIMVKSEALEVPNTAEPGSVSEVEPLTVTIKNDLQIMFNDGDKDVPIQATDLARTLRPKLRAMTTKVMFVDFEAGVPWSEVVGTMDSIRGIADDSSHDDIKIALKLDTAGSNSR
jgi:biopolymer transport protein TolR